MYIKKQNNAEKKTLKPYVYKRSKPSGDGVTKGIRGMPWLSEAKKDVLSCDKLRGTA